MQNTANIILDDQTYLLTNNGKNHKDALLTHLRNADEVWFGVAFLKEAGITAIKDELLHFLKNPANKAHFYIGLGLGETDPKSLQTLNKILKKPNGKLVLCDPARGIFHSKVYLFRTGQRASMVIGSSNLTLAGWSVNDEISLCLEVSVNDPRYLALQKYFKGLHEQYYSDDLDLTIADYAQQLKEYNNEKRPPFKFKKRGSTRHGLDFQTIEAYLRISLKLYSPFRSKLYANLAAGFFAKSFLSL